MSSWVVSSLSWALEQWTVGQLSSKQIPSLAEQPSPLPAKQITVSSSQLEFLQRAVASYELTDNCNKYKYNNKYKRTNRNTQFLQKV